MPGAAWDHEWSKNSVAVAKGIDPTFVSPEVQCMLSMKILSPGGIENCRQLSDGWISQKIATTFFEFRP